MSTRTTNRTMALTVTQGVGVGNAVSCRMVDTTYRLTVPAKDTVSYGPNYPNYQQRIAAGQSATTTMEGTKRSWSHASARGSVELNQSSPYWNTSMRCVARRTSIGHNLNASMFPKANLVLNGAANDTAASQLLQSLISAQTSWRGSNFVAELRETVAFLRRPLESVHRNTWQLIRKTTSMKRLFRRDPKEYGRLLGNAWLSWSFGVKPAISDIAELCAAINEMRNNLSSRDTLPIEGVGTYAEDNPYWLNRPGGVGFEFCENDEYRSKEHMIRYYGAVRATPPGFQAIMENFGFTPEDILPAVWEMIPWSFLLDYFVNINEQIEALRWMSADVAWLNRLVRNTVKHRWTSWRPRTAAFPDYVISCRGGAAWNATTFVSRTAVTAPPVPGWSFKIPGSLEKWINISALAAGIRSSKPLYGPQPGD